MQGGGRSPLDCKPGEGRACIHFFPAVSPALRTVPGTGLVLRAHFFSMNGWTFERITASLECEPALGFWLEIIGS